MLYAMIFKQNNKYIINPNLDKTKICTWECPESTWRICRWPSTLWGGCDFVLKEALEHLIGEKESYIYIKSHIYIIIILKYYIHIYSFLISYKSESSIAQHYDTMSMQTNKTSKQTAQKFKTRNKVRSQSPQDESRGVADLLCQSPGTQL